MSLSRNKLIDMIITTAALLSIAAMIISDSFFTDHRISDIVRTASWIAAMGAAMVGATLAYLNRESPTDRLRRDLAEKYLLTIREESKVAAQSASTATPLAEPDLRYLVQSVAHSLQESMPLEVVKQIEHKYGGSLQNESHIRTTLAQHENSKARLQLEISSLTKRANLNLGIGVFTTILAIAILAQMVLSFKPSERGAYSLAELVAHFIPRLSLGLFVEVFSFFFLKMYKSCLEDIKYYHNQITNAESIFIAIQLAFAKGASKSIDILIDNLTACSGAHDRGQRGAKDADAVSALKQISEVTDQLSSVSERISSIAAAAGVAGAKLG